MTSVPPELDPCGCCEAEIPAPAISNRPGQTALAYRVGTHASFLRRMLARLPSRLVAGGPSLAALTTRAPDDFSIALLDGWATAADVLAFYQERIANEGFLRTATERRSVLELARTIGYELRPGVAASAYLVFEVEDAPAPPQGPTPAGEERGSPEPRTVVVAAGTQVLSMPGQGQLPQTFETSDDLTAHATWNALRPRLTQPQTPAIDANDKLYLVDESGAPLEVDGSGDPVELKQLFALGTSTGLAAGDRILVAMKQGGALRAVSRTLRAVTTEAVRNRTRLDLAEEQSLPPAPMPPQRPPATFGLGKTAFNAGEVGSLILGQEWSEGALGVFLSIQGWDPVAVVKFATRQPEPPPPDPQEGVFALRDKVGFFGNTAPQWASLPTPDNLNGNPFPSAFDWDSGWEIWDDYAASVAANAKTEYADADVFFERSVGGLLSDTWVLFESSDAALSPRIYRLRAILERSLSGFAISAKATGVLLRHPHGTDVAPSSEPDYDFRSTTAYVRSERLDLAPLPIEDPVSAGTTQLVLDTMVLGLAVGQPVALRGERADLAGVVASEIALLSDVTHSGGRTTVSFEQGLQYEYVRGSLELNANVVVATHGQTVAEVLGSSDGSRANQTFVLKKPPTTYVPAKTPRGAASTLDVRVNGVLWTESPSLYPLEATSERYVVRIGDDGKTSVIFGDGRKGARLPTGVENVTSVYRSGIGLAGMVGANALTLLPKRPLGVRSVTNPLPASGAADPEKRNAARVNAPLTVLTLDRIVSVQDYGDFARGFAGVGKAQAVSLWDGRQTIVHVTVAQANGDVVDPTSQLYLDLVAAIEDAHDPGQPFLVDTYERLYFDVTAEVVVDPRYVTASVLAAVATALGDTFSFERREFAQSVSAAEVVAAVQAVDGVVASRLDELYVVTTSAGPPPTPFSEVLEAKPARFEAGQEAPLPAQLLLLNPAGITLTEGSE